MKNILKFFEYFMDETSNKIGDSSTEELTVTRIKNGFRLFANNFVIEIKDNPVPSIDSKLEELLKLLKGTILCKIPINAKDYCVEDTNILHAFKTLQDYLQNGVETKKEQPKLPTDLKIARMEIMSKHVNLRNSDNLVDRDLYHAFLDWEKEMWRLMR